MAFNLGDIRISADEVDQINGNTYIETARAYYNSNMYAEELNIAEVFEETLPVFNAVPKVVNIASAFAAGGEIEPSYEDSEWVMNVISNLALEQEKMLMCRDLILGKSILIEIASRDEESSLDPATAAFNDLSPEFPYIMSYYPSDEYEIISEGARILWAKIAGIKLVYNPETEEYDEVNIEKIYVRDDAGNAKSYVIEGDERSEETDYADGVLPLVEIQTAYDMKQLFYSVDRHNELESFIRNMLYLAGEPILAALGLDRINTQTAEEINSDRYKKLKVLFSRNEQADIRMLELQGSSASIMIEKQKAIIEAIIKDYPEYSISEVLTGSNVSEETTRMRMTEVMSRISEVKKNMETGLNKVIGIIAFLDGKDIQRNYVKFSDISETSVKETMGVIIQALDKHLISRKSAMFQIKGLFIGEDVDTEMALIEDDIQKALELQQKTMEMQTQFAPQQDETGGASGAQPVNKGGENKWQR